VTLWTLLLVNLATRRMEQHDRRALLGDTLLDAIRRQWDTSARRKSA